MAEHAPDEFICEYEPSCTADGVTLGCGDRCDVCLQGVRTVASTMTRSAPSWARW